MEGVRRFVLAAAVAVVLSACGGGGGGDGDGAGGALNGGAASAGGSPALGSGSASGGGASPTPTPTAQAFSAFGPVVVGSSTSNFHSPATARLAGGGNVVLWVEGSQIMARLTDAGGAPIGVAFAVNPGHTLGVSGLSAAPTADGGFAVAWALETTRPMSQFHAVYAIQLKRFTSAGDASWESQVNSGLFHSVARPVVKAAAGGFLVGWTSKQVLTYPEQAFLQRISADGARVGEQVSVSGAPSDPHEHLSIAPLQDGSVLAVWRQRLIPPDEYSLYTRRFSADLAPLTSAAQLPGTTSPGAFPVDAEVLSNGSVALAWGATAASGTPEVRSAVLAPDGSFASAVQATPSEATVTDVVALPFGDTGFGVASQILRTGPQFVNASVRLQRFDLSGAPLDALTELLVRQTFRADPATGAILDAGFGFDIAGGPDGHVVAAFKRADDLQANTYLMGR